MASKAQPLLRVLGACSALALSCLRTTPFGTDVEATDLTAENLGELARRGEPPAPYRFAALGDTHDDYDGLEKTIPILNARDDLRFVVHVGDMSDVGLLEELDWTRQILSGLRVPYLTVIGNHDALSRGRDVYARMYGPFDYALVYGGIKYLFFNSNALEFPGEAPKAGWLVDQARSLGDATGLLFVTHKPPTGKEGPSGADHELFYHHWVADSAPLLYVHGHVDDWRLYRWNGTIVLTCGTFAKHQTYTVVTVDEPAHRVSFERCRFEACTPVEPE